MPSSSPTSPMKQLTKHDSVENQICNLVCAKQEGRRDAYDSECWQICLEQYFRNGDKPQDSNNNYCQAHWNGVDCDFCLQSHRYHCPSGDGQLLRCGDTHLHQCGNEFDIVTTSRLSSEPSQTSSAASIPSFSAFSWLVLVVAASVLVTTTVVLRRGGNNKRLYSIAGGGRDEPLAASHSLEAEEEEGGIAMTEAYNNDNNLDC